MNAKELAIYAPLWAAVPATQPTDGERDLICDGGRVGWATYDGRGWYYIHDGDQVPVFIAAALCRVAAEDWMRARGSVTIRPDGAVVFEYGDPRAEMGPFSGPTIHHALVAAGLAVAGAATKLGGKFLPDDGGFDLAV